MIPFDFAKSVAGHRASCPPNTCFRTVSPVAVINAKDEVVAVLGDGQDVPGGGGKATPEMDAPNAGKFFAPHALTVDSKGSIYVLEWVGWGRVRKLTHTPV